MKDTRTFSGAKLRQARFDKGWSQAELARRAGVRERQIIRWENEQNEPRLEAVVALAQATERDVDHFFATNGDGSDESDEEESDPLSDVDRELLRVLRKWSQGATP